GGFKGGGEEYREFERLSEVAECQQILSYLIALDKLFGRLVEIYSLGNWEIKGSEFTFYNLLFNFWAREKLKLEPCFSEISLEETRNFFRLLRGKKKKPPYHISGFEKNFINDFITYTSEFDAETIATLKKALSIIWHQFSEEYKWVSEDDLDWRYSKFISIAKQSERED
ncbi:MAG: hypothetical protein DRG25_03805, partial [Deltaproteobacteria bacterium]